MIKNIGIISKKIFKYKIICKLSVKLIQGFSKKWYGLYGISAHIIRYDEYKKYDSSMPK